MRYIVSGKFYEHYDDAMDALGGENIPAGLPSLSETWELFRDGDGNATLIEYSEIGIVLQYWHAYYDAVQEIWRWQL